MPLNFESALTGIDSVRQQSLAQDAAWAGEKSAMQADIARLNGVVAERDATIADLQQQLEGEPDPEPVLPPVLLPADANVIRVSTTAQLLAAVRAHAWRDDAPPAGHLGRLAPRTIYVAEGVYEFDDSLIQPGSSLILQGAGRGRTVLRLRDNAAGFGSAATPKVFVKTGNALVSDLANSGFCNFIKDLTIDAGNNPGAVGVRFDAANVGSLERVDIVGNGVRGLAFQTSAGPAQCRDVMIDGFDVGIYGDAVMMNNLVFLETTIRNCGTGVDNDSKNFAFDGLVIENCAVSMRTRTETATLIVVDADLGSRPVIAAGGFAHYRNVTFDGILCPEWSTHPSHTGSTVQAWPANGGPVRSLNLPSRQTPDTPIIPLEQWANGKAGLQAAIDSGAEVVYIPYGSTALTGDVIVRGNVRVLTFMHGELTGTGRLVVRADHPVVIEHVSTGATIVHDSAHDVVVKHVSNMTGGAGPKVTTGPAATGDLFVENMGPKVTLSTTRPIRAFPRQMDRENYDWSSIGGGATVRMFGDNLEFHEDVQIAGDVDFVATGATVEIIGGTFDAHDASTTYARAAKAAYQCQDGRLSIVIPMTWRSSTVGHPVQDRRGTTVVGNVTDDLLPKGPLRGQDRRVVVPLYVSPGG